MDARVRRYRRMSDACKAALSELGLPQVPTDAAHAVTAMSAAHSPAGVHGSQLLGEVRASCVSLAGGLHPQIKDDYFRIGHMGAVTGGDLPAPMGAIEAGPAACVTVSSAVQE